MFAQAVTGEVRVWRQPDVLEQQKGNWEAWVHVKALPTIYCVTLGKSLGFYRHPFYDLKVPRGILWFIKTIVAWGVGRIDDGRLL